MSNPYLQGCKIIGEGGALSNYDLSDYLKNIRNEVLGKIEFTEDFNEILLTETVDGGNGVFDLKLIYFNDQKIIPVKIKYEFVNGKVQTKELIFADLSKRNHRKIVNINRKIKKHGEWNLLIDCIGFAHEQEVIFSLKEKDKYLYFAKFENFYFSKNPNIGISKDILYLVEKMEDF